MLSALKMNSVVDISQGDPNTTFISATYPQDALLIAITDFITDQGHPNSSP